jgi:hypothetical protein
VSSETIHRQIREDFSMSHRTDRRHCATAAILVVLACAGRADAGLQLITNGDFESGLSGWTMAVQPGSNGGWFSQTGTTSPLTNSPVQPPPGPTHAAMSDGSRGSQVLYQDFFVPQGGFSAATLSFDLAIANQGRSFFNPLSTLDYAIDNNLQARVDILLAGTDPFSVASGDVLLNLFTTHRGDPNFSGYTASSADLTALLNAHSGQTLRLRFAEVNGTQMVLRTSFVAPLNFGVDLVGLDVTGVHEPTSLALLAFGCLGLASYAWRRMRAGASSAAEGSPGPATSPEIGP